MSSALAATALSASSTRSTNAPTTSSPSPSTTRASPAHGGRVLPRRRQADGDVHLLRSGFGQSADRARQLLSRFRSVPGGDRQRPNQPIQPRRLSGTLSALSGGLSVDRTRLLQTRFSAHAR